MSAADHVAFARADYDRFRALLKDPVAFHEAALAKLRSELPSLSPGDLEELLPQWLSGTLTGRLFVEAAAGESGALIGGILFSSTSGTKVYAEIRDPESRGRLAV